MPDPAVNFAERLTEAHEEADALIRYFARHCPGGPDADASKAYSDLLTALSPAEGTSDEDAYKALMAAYRSLACYTFAAHEVHGRSILDTTRPCPNFRARLWDKRFRAVTLGVVFFISALLLHWIDAAYGIAPSSIPALTPASDEAAPAESQARGLAPSAGSAPDAAAPSLQPESQPAAAPTGSARASPAGSPEHAAAGEVPPAQTQAAAAASPEASLGVSLVASCVALLIPVTWGALGACTALAKRVSDRLAAMSYEENRMQGLPARIFLGSALALVLDLLVFVERAPSAEEAAGFGFGPIAGAFLAGLFVQHIYGALETMMRRVSRAISPEPTTPRE